MNPRKTTRLKNLILSPELEFLMEAHSGLSAKIVEEAGFKGIWGSGLALSASLGVRDNNEASWTQVLEMMEFMSDAASIPILLDGDTGYGNFNNMMRLVKKLEQRGVAGVCIEDKLFPKTNSFLRGTAQPLADIDEFCGKIKAGKDAQTDEDFVIVARVEALIAGWGLKEALCRAEAYRQAGADAVLIHSKKSTPDEIFAFLKEWADRHPVVLVPTKYYTTPTEEFRKRKVSCVIWANHLVRGSIAKMQEVARQVFQDRNLLSAEDKIVPVGEIFRLQGDEELKEAEKKYLTTKGGEYTAVILAASQGSLGRLTEHIPKAMLRVGQKSILEHSVDALRTKGVKRILVVAGYKREAVRLPDIEVVDNPDYAATTELDSLARALDRVETGCLVLFGDIVYRKYFLDILLNTPAEVTLIVDSSTGRVPDDDANYYIYASKPDHSSALFEDDIVLRRAVYGPRPPDCQGEWTGLLKLETSGLAEAKAYLKAHRPSREWSRLRIIDMLNVLVDRGVSVRVQYVTGNWADVNTLADLHSAEQLER
ncbi:MAG: phosphoenolpyruvate mutase [Candidatus Aminicenantes bacterium]|nr:phosphoenolpyruvate mutase [Candidatus Aminicenantes bacterium]